MLLSDLGADVIKVEQPVAGDPARILEPRIGDESAYFVSVNRGKKSITIDLSTLDGRRLLASIVPHVDVLVENFLPGTMKTWELDYPHLLPLNPRLVYLSISGFGQDGPYSRYPAFDVIIQAMSGLMSITGEPGGSPVRPGVSLGDSVAGLFGALSIVTALYVRKHSGQGEYIDLSMLDCQVTMMENPLARYLATGRIPGPLGTRHPAAAPFQAFPSQDGFLVVALITDSQEAWARFCKAVSSLELERDPRFATNSGRLNNVDALEAILKMIFAEHPTSHWLDLLRTAGIACGPVSDVASVSGDPQVLHRNMIVDINGKSRHHWRVANTPFRLAGSATGPSAPAPQLGEHTTALLREFGIDDQTIQQLRESSVI